MQVQREPPVRRMADSKKVAVDGGNGRFEDLPEPVLELLMSFLPARDAVRSSVLARRWRTLWKSVPALRFHPSQFGSVQAFNNFVNKLLEHRDPTAPLHECHSQTGVLVVVICSYISNNSVISKHLTSLMLKGVEFGENPLDLLSCLVTFALDDCFEWTPLLDSLPSLVTASIIIGFECKDNCDRYKYLGDCGSESCVGCYGEDDSSVLLEGLSGTTNLELTSEWSMDFDFGSSESYNPMECFLVSKLLKVVVVAGKKIK
ncbi:F-box/LRR-repeat protein 13-like [Aegilops tauschii subsp. strangulata]|uniref:F-box/LRR-repeat protein 13-like n=1 Tax=Aegilops tauschii subsp. strangulata TaxID=200361 RepID=UPI00098B80FF